VGEEATDGSSPPPFGQEVIERPFAAAPKYGIVLLPPWVTGVVAGVSPASALGHLEYIGDLYLPTRAY
jgi:hypothetical protein